MIVIVTPTVMDGTVVRWYRADGGPGEAVLSASRNGVKVRAYLHEVEEALPAARAVYETLRADRNADVSHLATHRWAGPFDDQLVEVTRG